MAIINAERKTGSPVTVLATDMAGNYLYTLTRELDTAGAAFFAVTAVNLAGDADISHKYRQQAAARAGYRNMRRCVR